MRRAFLPLVVLLACGCRAAADPELAARFRAAQEVFDAAQEPDDYLLAARRFEELASEHPSSGTLYFNLGNAYVRAGEKGRAVAAYRQAMRLRPRDPYLENNLRLALGAAPSLDSEPRTFLGNLFFWQDWLSATELGWLTGGLGTLTFLLALAALLRPHQRAWARTRWLALAFAVIAGAAFLWARSNQLPGRHGVVLHDGVVARSGNSETYGPAFTDALQECTEFELLESRGSWIHVRLPSGPDGWIESRDAAVY